VEYVKRKEKKGDIGKNSKLESPVVMKGASIIKGEGKEPL